MSWLIIVIIAHLFSAVLFIIDKYLLKREVPNPLTYAFWTGLLSIFTFILAPFGFSIPNTNIIITSLMAGLIWLVATITFYTALHQGESSRVVPTVGGLIPIFTLGFSFVFIGERLSLGELIAFCLLVSGGVMLSLLVTDKTKLFSNGHRDIKLSKAFIPAVGSALAFSMYFVLTKFIFIHEPLINGIIWIRLGAALGALLLLIPSSFRKIIFQKGVRFKRKAIGFFVAARGLGAVSGLLLFWAISLGSVTLVNALQGTQYLFLLLLAYLLFRKIPSLKEQFDKRTSIQKIFAIILICVGLAILIL